MADDVQVLQPVADVSKSGWSITPPSPDPSPGSIYPAIDGNIASDGSFVTATSPGGDFLVRLSKGETPRRGEHKLIVRRRQADGPDRAELRATLYQSSKVVLTRLFSAGSAGFDDYSVTLSNTEVRRLGDYKNLQLRVEVLNSTPSVCCPMVLQCEITASEGCGAFFDGTYGFYAPNPPDEQPVYGGVGPGWELDPVSHSNYAIMTINCTEDGRYVMWAQARRNFPDGSPAIYDEHQEFFKLEKCDDPVNWSMTFHLNAANFACPGGTVTFTVTKA